MKTCTDNLPEKQVLFPVAPPGENGTLKSGPPARPRMEQDFVTGSVDGPSEKIPQVSSELTWRDHLGAIKARCGIGRMHYTVDPGLYAIGKPDKKSPVVVTANYKMSFDSIRSALHGRNAWILVLNTKGINVWCAAGKGTFGTEELLRMIEASGLKDVVVHREIILPQLGAPGVSAHLVKRYSNFNIHYGPVYARDVGAYIDSGFKATARMRRKTFSLFERAVLIPVEIVSAIKPAMIIITIILFICGFGKDAGFMQNITHDGPFAVTVFLSGIFSGTILTPLFLPYIPGRAFTTKGILAGLPVTFILFYIRGIDIKNLSETLFELALLFIATSTSAYLAMNFTGASTYTSLSGVKKEMRWALPFEIAAGLCGFALLVLSRFF